MLCGVLLFALTACSTAKTDNSRVMQAEITKIENGAMLVTPVEGSSELNSSDSFHISLELMPASPEPEVGDIVEITYNGGIEETYPAGLENVTSIVVVEENEDPAQMEPEYDYPSCVMVDDILYKDTGYIDSMSSCGTMDGEITSSVDSSELPSENNQSNFGTGYEYQRSMEGYLTVVIDGQNIIFQDINSDDTSIPEMVYNFNAEVEEVYGDSLLVTPVNTAEGFTALAEGEYVVGTDNLMCEVSAGDIVTIWINGTILDTDPAQIAFAYLIDLAE